MNTTPLTEPLSLPESVDGADQTLAPAASLSALPDSSADVPGRSQHHKRSQEVEDEVEQLQAACMQSVFALFEPA